MFCIAGSFCFASSAPACPDSATTATITVADRNDFIGLPPFESWLPDFLFEIWLAIGEQ
jgi:hypothetical protein